MKLYPHQRQAVDIFNTEVAKSPQLKGRFVLPTGAGKTFIQATILGNRLQTGINNIHLVLAPRIVLLNQLMTEYHEGVRNFANTDFRGIAFHSGDVDEEAQESLSWIERSTTNPEMVQEELERAIRHDQDLVVFSTYHSMAKLTNFEFDTLIADECQFLVAENYNESLREMHSDVQLFFTATERHTSSYHGRGLNNTDLFGQRLMYISPAELINKGIIVAPKLHVLDARSDDSDNSTIDIVIQSGLAQHNLASLLGKSKILFAMKGTDQVKTIEDRIDRIATAFPNHDIFSITSRNGSRINNIEVERTAFLSQLKTCENALIFHYDILAEGIDVSGITGVVLMRTLKQAKLLQTIGRAVRVYRPNKDLKPFAWITIPVINNSEDDKEWVYRFCRTMVENTGYGLDLSFEPVIETNDKNYHLGDDDGLPDDYQEPQLNNGLTFLEDVQHRLDVEFGETLFERYTEDDAFDMTMFELGVQYDTQI